MNELLELAIQKKAGRPPLLPKKLSASDIQNASDTVRANLIEALLRMSTKLVNQPKLDQKQIGYLARLTDTAHKLFLWPYPKPIESQNQILNLSAPAVNLALIRTTPEQLRAKAREIAKETVKDPSRPQIYGVDAHVDLSEQNAVN